MHTEKLFRSILNVCRAAGCLLQPTLLTGFVSFLLLTPAYAATLLEGEGGRLALDTYLRTDVVTFHNVVDLDSHGKDDHTTYLGIDYSFALAYTGNDNGLEGYLKLERNGPFDNDAPLWVHNTLMTSGGVIEPYRNDELLPQVEEFWLQVPVGKWKVKPGLYAYEVGNGFSLNGSYENYGLTLSRQWQKATWRLYYCRPEIVYKNHLGPRIRQEEEQGIRYNHNAANFYATDLRLTGTNGYLNPYVGALVDYTSAEKRNSLFTAPVKKDILGTLGLYSVFEDAKWFLRSEIAHNFGEASSAQDEYKDIAHTGFLFFVDAHRKCGRLRPSLEFLLCSGNKVTPEEAGETTLTRAKNRAFSYSSPSNYYLSDSVSSTNSEARPIVAMGAGDGLNYGLPRPETFSASDFDNLIMPSCGLEYQVTEKLTLACYAYYLLAYCRGVGTLNGESRYLSRKLGHEIDASIEYSLNAHTELSVFAGVFFPGEFYRQERDDTSGSLLTPFVRGDGRANAAYQIECSLELQF